MTPENTDLSLVGFVFEKAYTLGQGFILRLQPPLKPEETDPEVKPCLHVAFYPAVNVNLPPGQQPDKETLMRAASGVATKILIMHTHYGELPDEMKESLHELTDDFSLLSGLAITGTSKPQDGSEGVNLVFGFQYRLQIDLQGAYVYPISQEIRA